MYIKGDVWRSCNFGDEEYYFIFFFSIRKRMYFYSLSFGMHARYLLLSSTILIIPIVDDDYDTVVDIPQHGHLYFSHELNCQ